MTNRKDLYIGLMSGTSLDGVDAVLVRVEPALEIIATHFAPFPPALREQLLQLCAPGENEIERMGNADRALGECYAHACEALLKQAGIQPHDIAAIGCHGQTIRHCPGNEGFSIQIGSADVLAARTGIAVVNNFRNRDMILGGQGAPLVPMFHARAFGHDGQRRAVINIGGMANVTLLHGQAVEGGFDTGPGNVLMDSWYSKHHADHLDRNGDWAASGKVIGSLLATWLEDPYFHQPAPKSTGREHFNLRWLTQALAGDESAEDIQATLAELTAETIAREVNAFGAEAAYVCGGGAHNGHLMTRLRAHLAPIPCESTDVLGVSPDWVEACAFAWLVDARLHGIPGNATRVTGASKPAILGALYLP